MTDMIEVKTVDLIGPALDWAVAQVQINAGEITSDSEEHSTGRPYFNCKFANPSLWGEGRQQIGTTNKETGGPWVMHGPGGSYSPSTDWGLGGPLFEANRIGISWLRNGYCAHIAQPNAPTTYFHADTALIAACRALVAEKLGETVSVPKELTK